MRQYPRGILNYSLTGSNVTIQWKITGNLGGESVIFSHFLNLNDCWLYHIVCGSGSRATKRRRVLCGENGCVKTILLGSPRSANVVIGWHQPNPPSQDWAFKSPLKGVATPGVEIFTYVVLLRYGRFGLNFFSFLGLLLTSICLLAMISLLRFRCEGPVVSALICISMVINLADTVRHLNISHIFFWQQTAAQNIGPQTVFPIPEGIINHQGSNAIALIHWNISPDGGRLTTLSLNATGIYQSGYGTIASVAQLNYTARPNSF